MIGHLIAIFVMSYAQVFLLGFQSQSVNHGKYVWAGGGSMLIAVTQANVWRWITADSSWITIAVYAIAGATGITSSMYVHRRFINKGKKI